MGLTLAFPLAVVLAAFALQALGPRTPFEDRFRDRRHHLAPLNAWIAENTTNEGRVAFMDRSPGYMSAARTAYFNPRQYIGGPFSQLNMVHSHASFTEDRFLGWRLPELTRDRVAHLLDLYNVGWIVTTTDEGAAMFRQFEPLLAEEGHFVLREPGASTEGSDSPFGGYRRRESDFPITLFRVDREGGWFLKGSGRVEASPHRLTVSDASPGGVVLKSHWKKARCGDNKVCTRTYTHAQPLTLHARTCRN